MHRSAIAKIEAGVRPVTIGEAVSFAEILGVPLAELIAYPAAGDAAHRARIDAGIAIASLKREVAERRRLVEQHQVLLDDSISRLKEAHQHLKRLFREQDEK